MLLSLGLCHSCPLEDWEFSLPFVLVFPLPCVVQVRHRPNCVVGRNHLSQVAVRVAVGAIGSSGCTGQVMHRSYSEKIGQAPASLTPSMDVVSELSVS